MQKLIYVLAISLLPSITIGQNENYVKSMTYQEETTDGITKVSGGSLTQEDKLETITYYDGLGRPMESIGIRSGGNGEDIVTHIGYDEFGRPVKEWLPYAVTTNGGLYRGNGEAATLSFYNTSKYENTPNPYSEKHLEASPLNRVLKQGAPGADWVVNPAADTDHAIKFDYQTNTGTEVRLFVANTIATTANTVVTYEPSLGLSSVNNGYYLAGTLYKTVTKDENWQPGQQYPKNHTTEEFKDKQGRVVLKRTYATTAHDTYYVYDEYGNLTYVFPPKANADTTTPSATVLSELCYQYKYDSRNRLVEKKIPGKDWEYIVYNTLDQPILTQDGNQRSVSTKTWLFTKYDVFGRVVYTGQYSSNLSRTALQQAADAISTKYESRQGSARSLTGGTVYYSNSSFPNTNITNLYTVNYYDSYVDSAGMSVPSSVLEQPTATGGETKGLSTVSKVKVLTTSNWNTTIYGYDKKGRGVYNKSVNTYLGTTDVVSSELDFVGKVKQTVSVHTKGSTNITTTDTFSYDHMGRLISQKQKINSEPEELIVLNTYDELGQLESKKVGGEVASTIENSVGLQTIDYTYNIRGWLKQINDPMNALGADLFAFKINYNDPVATSTLQSGALYNGNISETQWKTANDNVLRTYGYKYDALNRITQSRFSDQVNYSLVSNYRSNYSYDKNGNLDELQRNIWQDDFQEFTDNEIYYDYFGNKLDYLQIEDGEGVTERSYDYDSNGNMIEDNRYFDGFEGWQYDNYRTIAYNHLNLPVSVVIGGYAENYETREIMPTGNISYIYDALGTKLSKTVSGVSTFYAGNYIYEGSTLKFFSHSEGYVDAENGFSYVYQYKDHLGNIRLSYMDSDGNGSINALTDILEENNYYPFGLEHKGYNNVVNGTENNYKTFQGQEINKELGLNWLSFKYRNYDPAIGRFFNVDPLAEDYSYQSPYNFAENRVIDGIELEGLEWKSVKDEETGNTNVTLTIQLQDNSGLNDKQLAKVKENFQEQFSESFSGEGVTGELIIEDAVDSKGDFLVTLTDQKPNPIYDGEGNIVGEKYSGGKTPKDGSTQKNSFEVTAKTDGTKRGYSAMSRSFSHEAGHSAGLLHPWDSGNTVTDIQQGSSTVKNKTVRQNLMNSDQNPSSTNKGTSGRALTNGQLKSIDKLIREQQ